MCNNTFVTTEIVRSTVTQEIRELLGPCDDAKLLRIVQLVIPASPAIFVKEDVDPKDVGTNKTFNLPQMHPGQVIQFRLGPTQKLFGACNVGEGRLSLVVEHYRMED